jgi:outer membrane protein OmpA-like peptidoglycan-associated protein
VLIPQKLIKLIVQNMKSISHYKLKTTIILFGLLIIFTSSPAFSQEDTGKSFLDRVSFGVGGGLNFSSMDYSDPNLAEHESSIFPRGTLGVFAEVDLTKHLSLRPELYYTGRGQLIDDGTYYYRFASDYVDWRLPVLLNFGSKNSVRPYLMIAPSFNFATGGYVENENYYTDITDASLYFMDIELRAGAGIKFPLKFGKLKLIAGVEAAYAMGLVDNYSDKEIEGSADAINKAFYSIDGSRTNRGLSVNASIAFPLSNFKHKADKKEKTPSLYAQEKEDKKKDTPVEKSCYTIDEINVLIDADKSVDNKVICMENLNFEFNKSTLDKESGNYLVNVVKLLEKVPVMKMKIIGHTDNVGTEEYNMDLSKKRAAAVYNFLINKGISKDRLSYEYYGSSRPLVPNDSDANRALNRRVEFAITKK